MERKEVELCKQTKGRRLYLKHLDGDKLSYKEMVIAKCFECMNGHVDGLLDCEITDCPLYPAMPYRKNK